MIKLSELREILVTNQIKSKMHYDKKEATNRFARRERTTTTKTGESEEGNQSQI